MRLKSVKVKNNTYPQQDSNTYPIQDTKTYTIQNDGNYLFQDGDYGPIQKECNYHYLFYPFKTCPRKCLNWTSKSKSTTLLKKNPNKTSCQVKEKVVYQHYEIKMYQRKTSRWKNSKGGKGVRERKKRRKEGSAEKIRRTKKERSPGSSSPSWTASASSQPTSPSPRQRCKSSQRPSGQSLNQSQDLSLPQRQGQRLKQKQSPKQGPRSSTSGTPYLHLHPRLESLWRTGKGTSSSTRWERENARLQRLAAYMSATAKATAEAVAPKPKAAEPEPKAAGSDPKAKAAKRRKPAELRHAPEVETRTQDDKRDIGDLRIYRRRREGRY